MIRTLMILGLFGLASCTQPAPAPEPEPVAPAAPAAAAWQSSAGPDEVAISIERGANMLRIVCHGPKRQIRVDMIVDGVDPKVPDGSQGELIFGPGAVFTAPAIASAESGYVWAASFPATADLVTGFMLGERVQADFSWKIEDGSLTKWTLSFPSDGEVNQFATDCAQITGLKGG